jgi:serine protease AprX
VLSVDIVKTVTTGTGEITLSDRLSLANHPNPFTGKTTFTYSLPVDGKVTLEIYDIVGNKVKSLVDERQSAGDYQLKIDENSLQAGVYTTTLKLDSNGNLMTRTIKIICKY